MISAFLFAALFSINTLPDVTHIDGEVSTYIVLNISVFCGRMLRKEVFFGII